MDPILRSIAIYAFLMVIFRVSGKRSLSQITTFDFVLLLIFSEAIQQAMLGNDFSLTTAFLAITTLMTVDVGLSLAKQRFPSLAPWVESVPLILVENGEKLQKRLDKSRLDESDILEAARESQGLERMDQIKYAVLERGGTISIIPFDEYR